MMFCRTGIRKARVLPVPVRACAMLQKILVLAHLLKAAIRSSLHVNPFQCFVYGQALDFSHRLKPHPLGYSIDDSIADHPSLRQFVETRDGAIPSRFVDLSIRRRSLRVCLIYNLFHLLFLFSDSSFLSPLRGCAECTKSGARLKSRCFRVNYSRRI